MYGTDRSSTSIRQYEQRISELKWDFQLRVLPSGDFFVNAASMRIMTMACNLFMALKTILLPAEYKALRLKTNLFRVLGIPALITHHGASHCA